MESYVEATEFMLNVPDYSSGKYVGCKSFPLRTPGKRPCVSAGHFYMLEFNKPGKYALYVSADGASEASGVRHSNALFDLDIYSQEEKETSKSKSILFDEIFRKKTREVKLSKEDNIRLTKTIRKITNR